MSMGNEFQFLIYRTPKEDVKVNVVMRDDTIWLTQKSMAELFECSSDNISLHLKNIFSDNELDEKATTEEFSVVQTEGARQVQRKNKFYNLDAIISVGYRVNSAKATQFRIWATKTLKEYIQKGFVMDDDRLKNLGGGNYWKELLDRIRDIRSSEKVMYRQVLELYANAVDYDPQSQESLTFFKIVQNKLHYAAHGKTASEVIYLRVDSDKPFAGLTSFKGSQPTQAEAMIAKNYLSEQELKVLNNLVSAYFDLAEINAIEEREMRMADYVRELDNILSSAGRKLLSIAGTISHNQAEEKAKLEYRKYKAKTLEKVEEEYLKAIGALEHKAKTESRKKRGKV
jgi:hypothetical protein